MNGFERNLVLANAGILEPDLVMMQADGIKLDVRVNSGLSRQLDPAERNLIYVTDSHYLQIGIARISSKLALAEVECDNVFVTFCERIITEWILFGSLVIIIDDENNTSILDRTDPDIQVYYNYKTNSYAFRHHRVEIPERFFVYEDAPPPPNGVYRTWATKVRDIVEQLERIHEAEYLSVIGSGFTIAAAYDVRHTDPETSVDQPKNTPTLDRTLYDIDDNDTKQHAVTATPPATGGSMDAMAIQILSSTSAPLRITHVNRGRFDRVTADDFRTRTLQVIEAVCRIPPNPKQFPLAHKYQAELFMDEVQQLTAERLCYWTDLIEQCATLYTAWLSDMRVTTDDATLGSFSRVLRKNKKRRLPDDEGATKPEHTKKRRLHDDDGDDNNK